MKDCLDLVIISMFHILGIVDKRLKNNKISDMITNINTLTKDTISYLSLKESSWMV